MSAFKNKDGKQWRLKWKARQRVETSNGTKEWLAFGRIMFKVDR